MVIGVWCVANVYCRQANYGHKGLIWQLHYFKNRSTIKSYEVMAVHTAIEESPERAGDDSDGGGWMIKVNASDRGQFDQLMDRNADLAVLRG
jgi:hypothetical protein